MPATMRWLGLALLGILIAAAVAIAASRLASQQIGLASQPISAGDALAPAAQEKPKKPKHRQHRQQGTNRQKTTPTGPSTTPSAPPTYTEPPTYSEPPNTTPPAPPKEQSTEPSNHEVEHSGPDD